MGDDKEQRFLYLSPTKPAQSSIYDPLAEYQRIAPDTINIGRMGINKKPDAKIWKAVQQFTVKYDLFALNTVSVAPVQE